MRYHTHINHYALYTTHETKAFDFEKYWIKFNENAGTGEAAPTTSWNTLSSSYS